MSQFYEFSLGSNLPYTFDETALDRRGDYSMDVDKNSAAC